MSTRIDMQTQLFMQSKWIQTRNRFACTMRKQPLHFFRSFSLGLRHFFLSDALSLSRPSSITITYRFDAIYLYLMVIVSVPMRTQLILINWLKGKLEAFAFNCSSSMSIRFGFSCQTPDFFLGDFYDFHMIFIYSLFFFSSHVCFSKFFKSFHSSGEF